MHWNHFVALGDSITASVGDNVPGIESLRWADRIAHALRRINPGLRYDNLAQHGHTTQDVHTRQCPEAVALRPDLVSILSGEMTSCRRTGRRRNTGMHWKRCFAHSGSKARQ